MRTFGPLCEARKEGTVLRKHDLGALRAPVVKCATHFAVHFPPHFSVFFSPEFVKMGRRKRIYEVKRRLLQKARDKKKSKTGTPSIEKEESIIAESRLQPAATPPPSPVPPPSSPFPSPGSSLARSKLPTSAEKRKRFFSMESKEVADTSFVLIKKERLHQLAANTLCSECCTQTMECKITPHQIDTHIKLYCKNCAFVAMDTKGDSDTGKRGIHRLTVMLVYAMMLHGWLFRGVERVIAYIGLSRFTKETYVRYRQ